MRGPSARSCSRAISARTARPSCATTRPSTQGDVVFLESTYGDRDHQPFADTIAQFIEIVKRVVEQKGKILVPTFAVGRAQLLSLLLASMFRRKIVAPFPVFLDSPMAIEASRIYARHLGALRRRDGCLSQRGLDGAGSRHPEVVRNGRRLQGNQQLPRPLSGHGGRGHVHRRTHPASSSPQPLEPADPCDYRGLSGCRITGTHAWSMARKK